MTLTLAPDTEARLLAAAAEKGLAPEEVIDALLRQDTIEPIQDTPEEEQLRNDFIEWRLSKIVTDEAMELTQASRREEQEQARLQDIFAQLQVDALALETEPAPVRHDHAPEEVMFGEIITEKYRKQGFNLP